MVGLRQIILAAAGVALTSEDLREIEETAAEIEVHGARHPEAGGVDRVGSCLD